MRVELLAGDDRRVVADDADLAGDRGRGEPVVAGDDDDADARPPARRDGGGRPRAGAGRTSRRGRGGRARARRPRAGVGTPSRSARWATPSTRSPRLAYSAVTRSISARSAGPAGAPAPVAPEDRRAAGQQRLGRALASIHSAPSRSSTVDISFSPGSKWNCARRSRSRRSALRVGAEPRGGDEHRHLGRVARSASCPSAATALLQAAIAPTRRPGASPVAARPLRRGPASGPVHTAVTRMRFSVSVPVLSVQITSVEPSVSTALRRLTTAPRRASPRTPTASASVITGSRPSGTLPTSRPTAKTTESDSDRPAPKLAIGMKAMPMRTAMAAMNQATRRTCVSSGLSSRSTRSDSAAMRPSSVCIPVAKTTACASPSVQDVPENTTSRAWSSGPPLSCAPAARNAGTDSPVSVERSTSTPPESSRASAETDRPPRSRARRRARGRPRRRAAVPSRSTVACAGR